MIPRSSVRGAIRHFLESRSHLLAGPIVEIGSRCHRPFSERPWMNNRTLRPDCEFVGVDMQEGNGVDVVHDMMDAELPEEIPEAGSLILSEVLEHVRYPAALLEVARSICAPRAHVLVTVPFAFPYHGFPDDYYRYTASGLKVLAEDADFAIVESLELNHTTVTLSDHGADRAKTLKMPTQIGQVWVAV